MNNVQKWGFGMSPLKPDTAQSNIESLSAVKNLVSGNGTINSNNILDDISRVKGLFNRVVRQDQWDWFTINMYLDYPPYQDLVRIVRELAALRKAIKEQDHKLGESALTQLVNYRFLVYCDNYLTFDINTETPCEYLYILSRREENDILKIGMTTRNIQKRVFEINSATGVLFPYSARKVFKVKNSRLVEKEVHALLSQYRIRSDREFFRIEYAKACFLIEEYLVKNNQLFYNDD